MEGPSKRVIADQKTAAEILFKEGYTQNQIYTLLGIGKLETLCGKKKFKQLLESVTIKPPGKPTLVPETDPRPTWNRAQSDFSAIEEEI